MSPRRRAYVAESAAAPDIDGRPKFTKFKT
jgi:hypothetical protein